jgi:hypothetical protein
MNNENNYPTRHFKYFYDHRLVWSFEIQEQATDAGNSD